MFQKRIAGNQDSLSAHSVNEKGQGSNFKGNHYLLFSKTYRSLDLESSTLIFCDLPDPFMLRRIWQPHVLGRRLSSRFTFLECGHHRNKEKLLFGLDSVVHECTTVPVFLLKEIKHHIKTQYIWGRKDKNTKRACLISRNAILGFVSSGILLSQITKLI